MQLTVQGKQIDVGEALRQHVEDCLTETAEKYFSDPIEATVVFSKEAGHLFKVDISIHLGRGIMLQAHHEAEDPYPAFDQATDRVAKRMRRYKNKLKNHHKRISQMPEAANVSATDYILQDEEENFENGEEPVIVAETVTSIQEMTPGEAVMRMDLADAPALMFKNSKNDRINMVYRRTDGNIGWVDPA